MITPPPVQPGDLLYVVAPSSPFDAEAVRRGIAWLEGRYRVTHAPDLFERRAGFLAGSDDVRRAELQAALDTPGVAAILSARGGYGLTRLLDGLDWGTFSAAPRWVVGFSDTTALHLELARRGIRSLHAPHVAALAGLDEQAKLRWVRALEEPTAPLIWSDLEAWTPGTAEGPLFGGNLTVLFTQAAAGKLEVPRGAVLLLEDVSETSYRIDRMLTALASGGHLHRASGIVLGSFTDCSPGKYGVPTELVLRERLSQLGLPVAAALPVGHGEVNHPVPLGARARLEVPSEAEASRRATLSVLG